MRAKIIVLSLIISLVLSGCGLTINLPTPTPTPTPKCVIRLSAILKIDGTYETRFYNERITFERKAGQSSKDGIWGVVSEESDKVVAFRESVRTTLQALNARITYLFGTKSLGTIELIKLEKPLFGGPSPEIDKDTPLTFNKTCPKELVAHLDLVQETHIETVYSGTFKASITLGKNYAIFGLFETKNNNGVSALYPKPYFFEELRLAMEGKSPQNTKFTQFLEPKIDQGKPSPEATRIVRDGLAVAFFNLENLTNPQYQIEKEFLGRVLSVYFKSPKKGAAVAYGKSPEGGFAWLTFPTTITAADNLPLPATGQGFWRNPKGVATLYLDTNQIDYRW